MKNMNRRSYITTVVTGLLIACLLAAAFGAPVIINAVYDARMQGQVNSREVRLNTYELAYEHFAEKLYALGGMLQNGMAVENIRLLEDEGSLPGSELTALASQEVEVLLNQGLGMNIHFTEDNLRLRKLCTVLGRDTVNGENMLSGVRFYKLIYDLGEQTEEEYGGITNSIAQTDVASGQLTLYLDAEFYKLYAFTLENVSQEQLQATAEQALELEKLGTKAEKVLRQEQENITQLFLEYWGAGAYYDIDLVYDTGENWQAEKGYYGYYFNSRLYLKEDAYLDVWMSVTAGQGGYDGNAAGGVFWEWWG